MNPYHVLGVPPDAPIELITKQYRRLVKKFHPDRNPGDPEAAARYAKIDAAYKVLSDPEKRARFDATGVVDAERASPSDPAHAELCRTLLPMLLEVLQTLGQTGSVERSDVARMLRERLNKEISAGEIHRHAVERGIKALTAAVERFGVPEGVPNVLADMARAQLAGTRAELERVNADLERLGRANAYMKDVTYRVDDLFGSGTLYTTRMITYSAP